MFIVRDETSITTFANSFHAAPTFYARNGWDTCKKQHKKSHLDPSTDAVSGSAAGKTNN
jgi:hypothetical protein